MLLNMNTRFLYFVLIIFLALPSISTAQLFPEQSSGSTLSIEPRFPAPGEAVTVSLNDVSTASPVNQISWYINGQIDTTFANERSISIPAGNIGAVTNIEARLMLANGQPRIASGNFTPSRVLVTVEPLTSAPSWYRGRTMPSVGSEVRVVAIPQTGAGLQPDDYSYTWRINETNTNRGAILGRFSETFTVPFGRGSTISVDVNDRNGVVVARRSVFVPSVEPELYFYTTNPLRGQQPLALTATTPLIGDEMTVRAETFHLTTSPTPDMLYEWEVNGQSVENPSIDQQSITLQRGEGNGQFNVGFHVRNLSSLLQGAKADFNITF